MKSKFTLALLTTVLTMLITFNLAMAGDLYELGTIIKKPLKSDIQDSFKPDPVKDLIIDPELDWEKMRLICEGDYIVTDSEYVAFVYGDHTWVDIEYLSTCRIIKGNLIIDTSNQSNLEDLKNLITVEGNLKIAHNDNLTNLSDLSLETVDGRLSLFGNAALTDLHGLANLTFVGGFDIMHNTSLPTCEVEWLIDKEDLTIEGYVEFEGNYDDGTCD